MLDLYPLRSLDDNEDYNIYSGIIREIIVDLNNKFGSEMCNEKCINKIIKRECVNLILIKRRSRKKGVNITNDLITKEQKNNLKLLLQSRILHTLIITSSTHTENPSFYSKFHEYTKYIGITNCEWISKTNYDGYFNKFLEIGSQINNDKDKLKQVSYLNNKEISMFQAFVRVQSKDLFFKNDIDDRVINQCIEVFRELSSICENYLKFLYLVKHANTPHKNIEKLEFYHVWKDLSGDAQFKIFTSPFPDTDILNASKHLGIQQMVDTQNISYQSNRLSVPIQISYEAFIKLTRELYACTITLTKIKLILLLVSEETSSVREKNTSGKSGNRI
jgi:hypothetical protein